MNKYLEKIASNRLGEELLKRLSPEVSNISNPRTLRWLSSVKANTPELYGKSKLTDMMKHYARSEGALNMFTHPDRVYPVNFAEGPLGVGPKNIGDSLKNGSPKVQRLKHYIETLKNDYW